MSDANSPVKNSQFINGLARINREENKRVGYGPEVNGVFAPAFPMMTPKYARHQGDRNGDYLTTMARMYVQVPPDLYQSFLGSLPDDETRTIARVLAGDNAGQGGKGYFDFLLQTADHALNEKVQIVETLEDNYVAYFFGSSPPVWNYAGIVFNTYEDDWTMRMFRMYQNIIRGTALARRKLVMHLKYDSMLITGAVTSLNWRLIGGLETYCAFGFSILVKNVLVMNSGMYKPTYLLEDANFLPATYSATLAQSMVSTIQANSMPSGVSQTVQQTDWGMTVDGFERVLTTTEDPTGNVVENPHEVSRDATFNDALTILEAQQELNTGQSTPNNTVKGKVSTGTNEVSGESPTATVNR